MKKLIIASLLMIACAITFYCAIQHIPNKKKQTSAQQLHIALFTPIAHPALEEIEQGFKEELQKLSLKPCDFTTFNANGNRTLLRAQAEEIVQGNYDLIFSMGAMCSQTIAELIKKKGLKTPHVFAGVDGPEFALSLPSLNESTTGVYVKSDYAQELAVLFKLKPHTKNILLVYDPTHGAGLEKQKNEIEGYIKKYGATLHSVEIYQSNEIQQKVAASLSNIDVVLVLTDNTVVAGIDALIALCNRYTVTLLVSDLPSGKKGAVLAYGISEYESGSGAAQKAQAIVQGKKPHEIPISAITNFQIHVNKDALKTQNLVIDNETLEQLGGKIS